MHNDRESRIDELLARWEQAAATGTFLSVEELCPDDDPQLRAELAEAIDYLKRFRVFESFSQKQAQQASAFRSDQYQGIEEIDQGGQGLVLRARDVSLGREVAVKIVKDQWAWLTSAIQRFEQEARITGSLEHPGVIPIYGFGHDRQGKPFYAMRYVKQERTLKDVIADVYALPAGPERTVAFQNLLRAFLTVCRTVDYAHSKDIVHRDIKPVNVLIGDYGEVFVVDWGIAKRLTARVGAVGDNEAANQTPVGAQTVGQLGTPGYMSPEQAKDSANAGKPSDVYCLGATLYHVLTGQAPTGHGQDGFAPPGSVEATVPKALEAVCLKALRRDPNDRYHSAGALALEIERWLADEPVDAWPEPPHVRARRWVKRHRAVAAAGLGLLLMGMVALAVVTVLLAHWNNERGEFIGQLKTENEERQKLNGELKQKNKKNDELIVELERKNEKLADSLYLNQFLAAHSAWEQMDMSRAEAILDACDPDRRSFEWYYLKERCHGNRSVIAAHKHPVRALNVSGDGRWIAVTVDEGEIRCIETATGRVGARPKSISAFVRQHQVAKVRPDGKQIAAFAQGKPRTENEEYLARWDPETGEALEPIPLGLASPLPSRVLTYRNDGRDIAAVMPITTFQPNSDGMGFTNKSKLAVVTWDATTGKRLNEIPLDIEASWIWHGQFDAAGRILALWSTGSDQIKIRDLDSGKVIDLKGPWGLTGLAVGKGWVNAVGISHDGRRIATAHGNSSICLWDAADGKKIRELPGSKSIVRALVFSPDGRILASAGDDRGVKIWDTSSGMELTTLRGHRDQINSLAALPDGRVVSGGNEGSVSIWRLNLLDSGNPARRNLADADLIYSNLAVYELAFSPDRSRLFSGHRFRMAEKGDKIRVTELNDPEKLLHLPATAFRFALSPDGTILAAVGRDNIEVWDLAKQHKLRTIAEATGPIAFSRDGKRLAAVSTQTNPLLTPKRKPGGIAEIDNEPPPVGRNTALVIDVQSGKIQYRLDVQQPCSAVGFLSSTNHVVTCSRESIVSIWDSASGKIERQFDTAQFNPNVSRDDPIMVASPDGRLVATKGNKFPPTVRMWDSATGHLLWETRPHLKRITDMAITPDNRRLATCSEDKTVKLWDAASGQNLLTMPILENTPRVLAFSADSRRLACASDLSLGRGQILLWPSQRGP